MKKLIALLITTILTATIVKAIDIGSLSINPIITGNLAVISPNEQYSRFFDINTTGVTFKSCYDVVNYQMGSCNYLYKCYIILPENCNDITCAKDYDCIELTALTNPVPITVTYTSTLADIGSTHAVAVFLINSQMTYDFNTKLWSDVTSQIPPTEQYDYITIQGAVQPPKPPITWGWLTGLINWFCSWLPDWIC